jgi:4-amino-4-deoxy-L-arabinose transferase-like glycosyltransferase
MNRAAAIEGWFARAADALADPGRRTRAVAVFLAAYTAAWTLYGVLAKASQDLHPDMTEIVAWSRHLALGYSKHPPLAPYLARAWFSVFPYADWSFYLLAIAAASLTLWIAWRIALRYLDGSKALAATLLLTFLPFFNFHALKFNANTVLMPTWAATTWWFLISYETRSRVFAVLAGVGAGLAMLGKYWSVILLLGLGIAALLNRRRAAYFRSSAPYLTVASGALVIAPHVIWMIDSNFAPLRYATGGHAAKPLGEVLASAVGYLGGVVAFAALPLALVAILLRPSLAAAADTYLPSSPERRLQAAVLWLPLLGPALLAPFGATVINSIWSMPAWTLFGIVFVSSPLIEVSRRALQNLLACAILAPALFIAAAPGVAYFVQRGGLPPWQQHLSLLAPQVDRLWRETTSAPLSLVCGETGFANGVAFYSRAHPSVCDSPIAFAGNRMRRDDAIIRNGVAIVCPETAECAAAIDRLSGGAATKRRTVELSRSFMGLSSPPSRYLIAAIPPQL